MPVTNVATAADSDRITGEILKIAGVVVLGAIMSILDITVVNVALPTFQTTFGSAGHALAYSTVAWTVTGYTLALATVIPVTRLGRRPVRHQAPVHGGGRAVHRSAPRYAPWPPASTC